MPTPTLDQIDQQLNSWQTSIDVVAQNLTDLRALPVYQRLSGAPGYERARLAGETAGKVDTALDLMCQMFEHLERLYRVLNDAKHVRQGLPSIFGGEDKLKEIDRLLNTASIELPPVTTPVTLRGLLSIPVTERRIRPRELLESMIQAFEQAKSIVVEIDDAWRTLDMKVTEAEIELADLKHQLVSMLADVTAAEARIQQIRKEIDNDPLNARNLYSTAIEPLLVRLRKEIKEAARIQQEARQGLESAQALLRKLMDVNTRAGAAANEVRTKISSPRVSAAEPVDPALIEAMAKWADTLRTKFAEGHARPVLIGLERWNTRAREFAQMADAALNANETPIAERRELRGRLTALKAKAAAKGLAEDPALTELAAHAAQLLYQTPTPLEEAHDILRQFDKSLNTRSELTGSNVRTDGRR